MFKNYLTVAIRNLMRHQIYSFINITGLAVGMACCVLIGLYIHDELNYDQFKNADRIYRVLTEVQVGDQTTLNSASPTALQRVLEDEFPEVETAVKLAHNFTGFIGYDNKVSTAAFALTEPDFYEVFDIPLLKGSREDIMQQPTSVVLSVKTNREALWR